MKGVDPVSRLDICGSFVVVDGPRRFFNFLESQMVFGIHTIVPMVVRVESNLVKGFHIGDAEALNHNVNVVVGAVVIFFILVVIEQGVNVGTFLSKTSAVKMLRFFICISNFLLALYVAPNSHWTWSLFLSGPIASWAAAFLWLRIGEVFCRLRHCNMLDDMIEFSKLGGAY